MNVVDSSGWLEYFADGPNADNFAPALEDLASLLVSAVSIYEVFKRVRQQADETQALTAVALMNQARVLDVTPELALSAAELSIELGLAMADALILATAQAEEATLWTQDAHFARIEGVRYFPSA